MMSGQGELLKSAMHSQHLALEAKMSDEAGWSVPLSYGGPLDEAARTRESASIFDLSHFGRIRIRGDQAVELLERACTADVAVQEDNSAIWTPLCNDKGGIIEKESSIHLSNLMPYSDKWSAGGRLGVQLKGEKKIRILRKAGKETEIT